jgi:hypothetical protein
MAKHRTTRSKPRRARGSRGPQKAAIPRRPRRTMQGPAGSDLQGRVQEAIRKSDELILQSQRLASQTRTILNEYKLPNPKGRG